MSQPMPLLPEHAAGVSSLAVLLSATRASRIAGVIDAFAGKVTTWILVLRVIDETACELRQAVLRAGHDCLLIRADFHDPAARLQALAMATDFAGALNFMMDCDCLFRL